MLTIHDLHYAYFGHQECLHHLNATFSDGVSLVMGAEGSGKSTLLACIAGLNEPSFGEITLDGAPLRYGKEGDVGMVFGDLGLLERRTLYYNLIYPLRLRKVPKTLWDAEVERVCATWQIEPMALQTQARRAPKALRVKVALARASLTHRRVMLVDNPLSCLSPDDRRDLFVLLATHLATLGDVVLYATDQAADIRSLAAPTLLLSQGYGVAMGMPDELAATPPCLYAAMQLIPCYVVRDATAKGGKLHTENGDIPCHYPTTYEGKQVTVGIPPDAVEVEQAEEGTPVQTRLYVEGEVYIRCQGLWAKADLPQGSKCVVSVTGEVHCYDPNTELRLTATKESV